MNTTNAGELLASAVIASLLMMAAAPCIAEDAPVTAAEGAPKLRDLCTDRPTKNSAPCTVDSGHFQIESDLFNATLDRTGGVNTNTYLFTNPVLKYGLTDTLDIEAAIAPIVEVTTHDRKTGANSETTGVGDLFLKAKLNLNHNTGSIGAALVPYIKVPTATNGVGNGAVEGGFLLPISISLPAKFSLSTTPEVDVLKDRSSDGRHANVINVLGLTRALGAFTVSGELWSDVNFDPAGRTTQFSADTAITWVPKRQPDLQFDGGLNFGLNRVTPGVQAYVGVSHRF